MRRSQKILTLLHIQFESANQKKKTLLLRLTSNMQTNKSKHEITYPLLADDV